MKRCFRIPELVCAPLAAWALLPTLPAWSLSLEDYEERVVPLLETHCLECHGGEKIKGGVDFTKMTSKAAILGKAEVWRRAREALDYADMPPYPEDTDFTEKNRDFLMRWIREAVETIDLNSDEFRHPGPALTRQLTPYEYMRTMQDLLHLEAIPFGRLGIEQEYPHEGLEFVNQALGMSLSPDVFDRYLRTGEEVLKQLFGDESGVWRKTGNAHRRYRKAAEAARPKVLFVEPGEDVSETGAAERILERFAIRAFRRPLKEGELEGLMSLFRESKERGGTYEASLQAAMSSVLASPHFLLRIERGRPGGEAGEIYPVEPHELATRLSYFLWSTQPDEALLERGLSGDLADESVLLAEVKRMLQDEKAEALTDHFARQWLQLRLMEFPSIPNRKGFPKLTDELETAFRQEINTFFTQLRVQDGSILDLLISDYTYADRTLASFYGLSDPAVRKAKKGEMVRVALEPDDHRGGLLGMGGYLWMTSHESRTKPTVRGTWILEVILGTPPPPPPPEAGSFVPPDEGQPEPKNFREKLEMHASDPNCAGCHAKIDPLGFALENFDAIGSWRTEQNGDPVDNSGELSSGESFQGFHELREVMVSRKDQFTRNFVAQLLRYALGRELLYSDRGTVESIAREVEAQDYRFSAVIEGIVTSRAFRYRSNLNPEEAFGALSAAGTDSKAPKNADAS